MVDRVRFAQNEPQVAAGVIRVRKTGTRGTEDDSEPALPLSVFVYRRIRLVRSLEEGKRDRLKLEVRPRAKGWKPYSGCRMSAPGGGRMQLRRSQFVPVLGLPTSRRGGLTGRDAARRLMRCDQRRQDIRRG